MIWTAILTALTPLGLPIAANVYRSATGADLPATFIVYQVISTPVELSADNMEKLRSYRVQISVFARAGLSGLPDVIGAMVTGGFKRAGGRDLPFNQATGHFGQALDFTYIEEV